MMTPLKAAYAHVAPLPKLGPEDPGPFSFASEERVRRVLGDAGFLSIALERLDLELDIAGGRGLDEAVASALEIGATSRAIEGQPRAVRDAVAASVRRTLAEHRRGSAVPLGAAIWLVAATGPRSCRLERRGAIAQVPRARSVSSKSAASVALVLLTAVNVVAFSI